MTDESTARRDPEEVQRFVERFASQLVDAGWQRMPARVFSVLMATDSGTLTAAELAERLQVSPAAISGAVRYLTLVNMAQRERDPGSRRDLFRVRDDVWKDAIVGRNSLMSSFQETLYEGAEAAGPGTQAGHRLAESADFLAFLQKELGAMLDRWHEERKVREEGIPGT